MTRTVVAFAANCREKCCESNAVNERLSSIAQQALRLKLLVLAMSSLLAGPVQADGDVAKGEKAFKKCLPCHSVADKTNKMGPYLTGVVGRPVASVENYQYSPAMKEYAALTKAWDEPALNVYLENPKAAVPKTKMVFPGLKKPDERADLIAYLKTKM
jgi:cytochrome c